jgi:hypothetical protein
MRVMYLMSVVGLVLGVSGDEVAAAFTDVANNVFAGKPYVDNVSDGDFFVFQIELANGPPRSPTSIERPLTSSGSRSASTTELV